ncbi:MAG: hypothetical protein IJD73_05040 [Clostridia bacterium]|nr:hypothetical protein [Clostridia bacterium]
MENIYTIPVNEAFEESAADKSCGCPFCALYNKLEDDQLELILGASMMEPDVRIKTNEEGFCRTHYDMMFTRKNRLGMALTLESHLAELKKDLAGNAFTKRSDKAIKRIDKLDSTCFVCRRIEFNFEHMIETAVILWDTDEDFRPKLLSQPYFCLPHYSRMLKYAQKKLDKKSYAEFEKDALSIQDAYLEKLGEDVSWFCKKFDYRYKDEPWYESKDSVERSMKFLRSDLHHPPQKKKPQGSNQ